MNTIPSIKGVTSSLITSSLFKTQLMSPTDQKTQSVFARVSAGFASLVPSFVKTFFSYIFSGISQTASKVSSLFLRTAKQIEAPVIETPVQPEIVEEPKKDSLAIPFNQQVTFGVTLAGAAVTGLSYLGYSLPYAPLIQTAIGIGSSVAAAYNLMHNYQDSKGQIALLPFLGLTIGRRIIVPISATKMLFDTALEIKKTISAADGTNSLEVARNLFIYSVNCLGSLYTLQQATGLFAPKETLPRIVILPKDQQLLLAPNATPYTIDVPDHLLQKAEVIRPNFPLVPLARSTQMCYVPSLPPASVCYKESTPPLPALPLPDLASNPMTSLRRRALKGFGEMISEEGKYKNIQNYLLENPAMTTSKAIKATTAITDDITNLIKTEIADLKKHKPEFSDLTVDSSFVRRVVNRFFDDSKLTTLVNLRRNITSIVSQKLGV